MSFDWQCLISDDIDTNDLACNIRRIYELKSRNPSEVALTVIDENRIISVCKRAVQPRLLRLFESMKATEKLLTLVLNYITTVNDLTTAIFNQDGSNNLKFESAISHRLVSNLQLRNEFLKAGWPIDDENSDNLLDSICDKYPTLALFRSLSYDLLNSDYLSKATGVYQEILENVWVDENDLRKKVKEYKLPLSLVTKLGSLNVNQLDDLTKDQVETLIKTDQKEMKEKQKCIKGNSVKCNALADDHSRFKANLKQMFKIEGRQGKEKRAQREEELKQQKKSTEEAIKAVENITKDPDRLAENSKKQLEKYLEEIASGLHANWRFTDDELSKPVLLLNSVLTELNNANKQFDVDACAAYKSDEEIIEHVSGGIILYGLQLTDPKRLGEKSQRPLLSRPAYCPLSSPSLSFESTQQTFTSLEASNQFIQRIKTSGLTVAAYLEASGWGFQAKTSFDGSSNSSSTSFHQKKTQSTVVIQVDYIVVPMKCFRIPREEMKLSTEAQNTLAGVNSLQKAKEFLGQYHSHVSDGFQHVGGILMRTVAVETAEETDVQSLKALAAETMNKLVGGGGSFTNFSAGAGVSKESFETKGNKQGEDKIKCTATITRNIQCIGPPCHNQDLFVQALRSNNSSWYVIDRDALSSFIPIWEIIQMRYSSQREMMEAANLLKHAWLLEAQDYEDILLIKMEIQRVQCGDYITNDMMMVNSLKYSSNTDDKSSLEMLEANIRQYSNNFDISQLSPSMLLYKVMSVFQLIIVKSNTCQKDFLTMLLQRDTMKSFLKTLALCSDKKKLYHILPILAMVFSDEKVQDLHKQNVKLEPEILRMIQQSHEKEQYDNDSSIDVFKVPTVPLNQLSSYLTQLMIEKSRKLSNFTIDIALIISKSLRDAVKTNLNKYVEDVKTVLITYGWSNAVDGFVTTLTVEGLKSLFDAINDVFREKGTQKLQRQRSALSTVRFDSDKSTEDRNKIQKILYDYTYWLIDRPVAPVSQPVQRLIDILRHRLRITSTSFASSTAAAAVTANTAQPLKGWRKKTVPAATATATATTQSGSEVLTTSTTTSTSDLLSSSTRFQTIYDVLIDILSYSDLLCQIELFRLLIERRTAIPILIPSLDCNASPYNYLINALSFVTTKLSQQREYNLSDDCSLLRIAVLSMRQLEDSESSEWVKQVFSCQSLILLSSVADIKCIQVDRCIAEIGVGFIPCSNDSNRSEKYQEVLILNVIGNYSSIWSYINEFADVLMVEEDPSNKTSFQPVSLLNDNCCVITWKAATRKSDPTRTAEDYLHVSSSIIQTVDDIQTELSDLLLDKSIKYRRSSLISMNHSLLYPSSCIKLIDTESIVRKQNYSKVRVEELPLQQLFIKESENITLKNKNKNNDPEQQRFQRLIDDCQQERCQRAYDVEKHPLLQCFIGILSLENRQLRTLAVHQLIQQIEFHSRSAMKELIDRKDEAFNEYDRDQQNQSKQKAYFEAKRLYANSVVGIDHLWREICHLYASNPSRYENYPALAAKHLIDGFALELLDGDAGMLEQTWIKAVFLQIEEQLMKQRSEESNKRPIRIFILSVLGVQSTGKSTLLNLMFGVRLRTSAGMCTRGVNIQLLKAENRNEYDYILLLDTEGIRAPEFTGLADATWRDNRIATFAILPADATIILINSEDDSAAREVLPIVMLVYQQSELAASSTSQLSSRIFFVYTRVDMNDTKKLVNNIQAMFIDLNNNAQKLQGDTKNQGGQDANQILFRDFRVKAEGGEVGGKESDIKFLGKLKKSDIPPDDVPDTEYGELVTQLNEYIYNRVISKTSDGQQWKARNLSTFAPYLDSIWQCILSADFTLSFKTVMERMVYDKLQTYCISKRTELANLFSTAYDIIEKKIIVEQLPDQQTEVSQQQERDICMKKTERYQSELSQLVDVEATKIDKEVLQHLKDERFQQWFTGSKDSWTAFYKNLKAHNNSRIYQLVTNRLSYDNKLIYYQQQIRKNITSSFQNKTEKDRKTLLQNHSQQQIEFNNIYENILSDARRKHPSENVESNIRQLYENNGIGRECNYILTHRAMKPRSESTSFFNDILSYFKKFLGHTSRTEQEKFLLEIFSDIDGLLTPIKRYSDNIVQQSINYTRAKLTDCGANQQTKEAAHQMVYALLIERLKEKQHQWEQYNSISVRLTYARNDLWHFYWNTIKGIVGVQLLTSDLKLILLNNDRLGLVHKIIKYIVHGLQNESWVKHSRVLMARVDLDLLNQIKDGKIQDMIYNVTHSSKHYQKIVKQLIQTKVTDCVQNQLAEYRDSLKLAFNSTVIKTQQYRNTLCATNEKEKSKISQGRTQYFLEELVQNLNSYQLPVIYADAVRTLNHENYARCDHEPTEIWKKMTDDLFATSSEKTPFELTENDRQYIINSTLDEMINNQKNEAVKMRCSEPCPRCKMPCKRSSGHISLPDENERRHDCDHQPTGLGGIYWGDSNKPNYRELVYESCSNSVAANNRFLINGAWQSYRNFAEYFPSWLTPRSTTEIMHEVRQYIFYNYQKELAQYYNLLPCSNIPPSFNQQRSILYANLKKIIIENN